MAYKLGYGDYVWSRMNNGYPDSKGFRFKGIPLEDRIKDRSVVMSHFFEGVRENDIISERERFKRDTK